MKSLVYLLFVASMATGQLAGDQLADAAPADATSAGTAPAPAGAGQAPAGAGQPPAGAPQAPAIVFPNPQAKFGPSFFGPGLNNPRALPASPIMVQQAKMVLRQNPTVRAFVDVDGSVHFTDEYGREVEVLNELGVDIIEKAEEMAEMQAQLALAQRQAEFTRRSQQFQSQLRQQLGLGPVDGTGEQFTGEGAFTAGEVTQAFADPAAGGAAGPNAVSPIFRVIRS